MHNKNLYNSLRAYCELACALLQPIKETIRPLAVSHLVTLTDEGQIGQGWKHHVPWQIWVEPIEEQLEESAAAQDVQAEIEGDPSLATQMEGGSERLRRSVFFSLLDRQQGVDFRVDVFDKLYGEIESYLTSETYTVRHLALPVGFESPNERIEIEPGLAISRLEKNDREEFLTVRGFFEASRLTDVRFAIEVIHPKRKAHGLSSSGTKTVPAGRAARETITAFCTAMRLFKAGRVGYSDVLTRVVGWSLEGGRHSTHSEQPPVWNWGDVYTISIAEADAIRECWTGFKRSRTRRSDSLDLSLRRFSSAYERSDEDDRLMDLVLAMEPLLLGGFKQEIRYRFSLRGAYILGADPDSREAVFNDLYAGYGYRNELAHGNETKRTIKVGQDELSIAELNLRLGQRARELIRVLLDLDNRKAFFEKLDRAIARGVAP